MNTRSRDRVAGKTLSISGKERRMQDVRVRFAPSPTGFLHVGGARTALFNWLFARRHGGAFILRMENTDIERSSGEREDDMLEDLAWLGLDWDEGPRKDGDFGPYRQSERIEIYRQYAEQLLEEEKAYPCFCTPEELERKRKERIEEGRPPRYDGSCRNLTGKERAKRRADGRPESIRFIVTEGEKKRFSDIIRGEVEFPHHMVGDFVILRSNGLPTYNFAAAIDDALMKITHVVRGEEHLSNTLRQLMIYDALGFGWPAFAHIPLILGSDRTKLSKRKGAPNIRDFRERGYPREGIVNYLAFLGWSPPDRDEILSVEELVREFSLERVSESPSIFDVEKLNWVSAQHTRRGGAARYFEEALPYIPGELKDRYRQDELREIFDIVSENMPFFSRLMEETVFFRPGPPGMTGEAVQMLKRREGLFSAFADAFGSCGEWNTECIRGAIKEVGKRCGVKGKELYMPLRAALTGALHGPDLASIVRIRGKKDVIGTLKHAAGEAARM